MNQLVGENKKVLKLWSAPKKILLNISFTEGKLNPAAVEGADPNRSPCTRPTLQCGVLLGQVKSFVKI